LNKNNEGVPMEKIVLFLGLFALTFGAGEWAVSGKHQAYPNALYFVGIGLSERGVNEAKQSAMIEIKKQISVSVNATTMDEMSSFSINGVEKSLSKSESRAKLTTGGDIQGVEVVETTQKGKIFYALAVLEKEKFVTNARTKIQELKADLRKQMSGASEDISAGKIGLGMKKLSAAKRAISDIMEQRTLLSAAAEITAAEKVDVSVNDIAALYEKCVASIKVEQVEGDKQELSVGMVPEIPFTISVTAEGTPVSGVLVVLMDDNNKKVMEKFTDENGQVSFSLGENINSSVGKHSYTTNIKLPINSNLQKVLASTNQTFSYTVKSNPCYAKIEVKVSKELTGDIADLTDKVVKLLGKYDVQLDAESENVVEVSISAKETGNVQGLSEARTFVKTDVTLGFALKQDAKSLVSFEKVAKGTGSTFGKSVAQALPNVGIKADIKMMLDKICGATSDTPKRKIAVFPFKNLSGWSDWFNLAETMSDMIITKLINSKKFEVIERSQIDKIMEEKSLGQSGVIEQAEAIQAAKIAGAELLLIGSASIINGKIEVDARVINAASGSALTASNSSGFDVTNLRPLADDIVSKIKVK
jgi:TolB-like protein